MREQEISINILNGLLDFSKKYPNSIDWKKFEKESIKMESKFKNLIIPSNNVKNIFSNRSYFKNLNEIKDFMSKNFKHNIKERTTIGVLSYITYITIKNPSLILKIENIIKTKSKIIIPKKKPQPRISQPNKSWKEWTKYESEELHEHLDKLTLTQIKPKLGKLLSSSEKKLRKAELIEVIVKKIKKLKIHYEMGPG